MFLCLLGLELLPAIPVKQTQRPPLSVALHDHTMRGSAWIILPSTQCFYMYILDILSPQAINLNLIDGWRITLTVGIMMFQLAF